MLSSWQTPLDPGRFSQSRITFYCSRRRTLIKSTIFSVKVNKGAELPVVDAALRVVSACCEASVPLEFNSLALCLTETLFGQTRAGKNLPAGPAAPYLVIAKRGPVCRFSLFYVLPLPLNLSLSPLSRCLHSHLSSLALPAAAPASSPSCCLLFFPLGPLRCLPAFTDWNSSVKSFSRSHYSLISENSSFSFEKWNLTFKPTFSPLSPSNIQV